MDSRIGRAGPLQAGVELLLVGRGHQIGGLDHALHQHALAGPHREDDFAGKAVAIARDASGVVLGRDLDDGHGAPACSGNEGSTLQSAPRKALPQNIPKFSRRSTNENRGFPMRRVAVAAPIAVLCLSLSGCGDPTAPAPVVTSVTVTVKALDIAVGSSISALVSVAVVGGAPQSVQWVSDDPTTVAVNGAGTITANRLTAGVAVCAVSTFDSSKKGCVTIRGYTDRTVRYWLALPSTVTVPGQPSFKVQYGESFTYRSFGSEFAAKIDAIRYTDGTVVPADLDTPFCLFFFGACDVTASLIIDYYTPDVKNQTAGVLWIQVRRPASGATPAYTCVTSVAPGALTSLPYYQSFGHNPFAGELRVSSGPGCTGTAYDVTAPAIDYQANPSGFVTISLTKVP